MKSFKQYLLENYDTDVKLKKLGLKRGGLGYKVGKVIGGEVYVHKQYENQFPQDKLEAAKSKLPKEFNYHVVKYNPKTNNFSFIISNDFDTNPEPSVNGGITVKEDGTAKPFKDAGWIYHHKHQFVDDDYKGFDTEKEKQRSLKWSSLPDIEKSKIGQRKYWDEKVIPRINENNSIPGVDIIAHIKRIGTAGGLSSYLANQIKNQNFQLTTISIDDIFKSDLDVKSYVDAGKLRKKYGGVDEPIVIGTWDGKKNQVMDGYNRILQKVKNGESNIKAYVAI